MVEDEMVPGDGWISDESSFYGDDGELAYQLDLCAHFNPKPFWSTHHQDLNIVTMAARSQQTSGPVPGRKTAPAKLALSTQDTSSGALSAPVDKPLAFHGLDRKAMEQERLARLGKRKRDTSPPPPPKAELFNCRQGYPDSWQLGETVDDFVKRIHPLSTLAVTCDWIWVANPYHNPRDKYACPRVEQFTTRGMELLKQSRQDRQAMQANDSQGSKGMLTKFLNQEGKALQQRIADLAEENNVLSGKWMLFPKSEDVTRMWKLIVKGVIDDRLGTAAKVATDDGRDERLICVYTRNFRDANDVRRVLCELEAMGLLNSGRTLYYKPDAYTYLDINSTTATQYGLQASLHNSRSMMAAVGFPQSTSLPRKKQSTLNQFF
ncbi:DUF1917-domain-containing protein [Cucurbitaria berberidis CBS 394.84]|uniref:DUF1917-domain-containing protein n=1 Tax=Cucurbitaria berberidis CBS 394.84 TaxID=1168544 RepID=A0A9P4L3G1_9PLEO|nr:DUF1917-domain-containing protein [Cucurbitaria berberidis CBS 394.84]KAF1840274.1 DUF1917-domain-containing protein [Cucurbitaria berberidis CBS 394.84]